MSHPNNVGNGCSLEDCHTNLFALTDLAGIRWRKFKNGDHVYNVEPLEDPILQAFTKCIQSDILCVWQRAKRSGGGDHSTPTGEQLNCSKELWLFWYGEEPSIMSTLHDKGLQEVDSGSWNAGLTYECRTLLFKALHNLIERCLLARNFVRIGKWFVQPFDHLPRSTAYDKSTHLSIKFSFFLHGESTVCTSIDVRQHPPLWRLHPYHLNAAMQLSQQGLPVVLAPYGLNGTLTGHAYSECDVTTQRILEEWEQFFVVPYPETWEGNADMSTLPKVVEVVVAGVRMRYPASYILVHGETEAEIIQQNGGVLPLTPPHSANASGGSANQQSHPLTAQAALKRAATGYADNDYDPVMSAEVGACVGARALYKMSQDGAMTSGVHMPGCTGDVVGQEGDSDTTMAGSWELGEPLQKNPCACHKSRGVKSRSGRVSPLAHKHKGADKPSDKVDKEPRRRSVPFHRRSTINEAFLIREVDVMMMRLPPQAVRNVNLPASTTTNSQPDLTTNTTTDANPSMQAKNLEGSDSPNLAVPLPILAHIHPSLNHNHDVTMPTLSPQPLSVKTEKVDRSTDLVVSSSGDATLAVKKESLLSESSLSDNRLKVEACALNNNNSSVENVMYKTESINTWLESQRGKETSSLKRPSLAKQGYETEDDRKLDVHNLYDFDTLNQWLDYPLKRQKVSDPADLGSQTHDGPLSSGFGLEGSVSGVNHDPYEFSDEASSGNVSYAGGGGSGNKRAFRGSVKDEPKPLQNGVAMPDEEDITFQDEPAKPTGMAGLSFTDKDLLMPKYELPDNIFDTSDDDSIDDGDAISDRFPHSEKLNKCGLMPGGLASDPEHASLAQMFPTPPTNENQHTLSPGQGPEFADLSATDSVTMSLIAEPTVTISDYSFVYKPAVMSTFVSSSKYSPIELPSKADPISTADGSISTAAGSFSTASDSISTAAGPVSTVAGGQVPAELCYTPSWQHLPTPIMNNPKIPAQSSHYASVELSSGHSQPRSHVTSSQETSPAMASGPRSAQQLTPRTPLSLEIQSPLSNASSYMHNLKSVDNPTNSSLPEVNSVVVNIMLSDSLLNLFKDENFESCTICVCNMNIKGADVGLYLPDKSNELQYACTCGFSAVVNRRHGRDSGLFYEDEVEITGLRDERLEARKPSLVSLLNAKETDKSKLLQNDGEIIPQELLLLLQGQFTTVYPSLTVTQYCSEKSSTLSTHAHAPVNILERLDACEACYCALEVGRQAMDNCTSSKLDDPQLKKTCIHHWPYLNLAKLACNSQETLRKLRSLLPLLEDAIQKKRTTRVWESVYRISGPLSWKDFHLLAGRDSDETSEPQPIPAVLVGFDKEWMTVTPQALQYWDKLMLEPYGKPRDIAYIVVCPETDYILERVKTFFRDLSQQYELCRLGRHRPIAKKIREGILRVNKKAATLLEGEPVDEWFKLLGDDPLAAKLRLYAQVCKHQLAPFLTLPGSLERKDIFEEYNKKPTPTSNSATSSQPASLNQPRPSPAPTPSPSPAPPHTPGGDTGETDDSKDDESRSHPSHSGGEDVDGETDEGPSVVIYIVDPFTYGQEWSDLPRFAMLGLLRCYQETLRGLPEHLRDHVHLQVISLRSILQYRDAASGESLRSLALAVYTQCRRLVTHSVIGRTLTGFGPAAAASDKTLKSEPGKTSRASLYSPPYVIAPTRAATLSLNQRDRDHSRVLLCGYCLSEDQRWLLGVCTDNRGEFLETCTINIEIPNRNRRKTASARKIGLRKLWDFILGVMSTSVAPWRLVIGRFGRIGKGELIGWGHLLSPKNLQRASKQLRDTCNMCGFLSVDEIPCIHSACLVSMEMHPSIFVMPDTLKIEERQSSRCQLTTPRDASVTHILVMPTSATASSSQGMTSHQPHMDGEPIDGNLDLDDMDLGDMTGIGGIDEIGDISDLFSFDNMMTEMGPGHHNEHEQKPHGGLTSPNNTGPGGRLSPGHNKGEHGGSVSDVQDDEHPNLLQQPLAIGYYVSTAKTGPLPTWFFTACPHKHDLCPNCFKAALHVNCANVQQQDAGSRSKSTKHQLDSHATPDVLRYVLETYNSLSWLTMDPQTNDRRSCLPVHFVVLMQLYHAMNTFV